MPRSPPPTRPWRPRPLYDCVPNWCAWWSCFPSAPRPRPGGSDGSRLASRFQCSTIESWSLKSWEHVTLIWDMREFLWYKTWHTIQKSTVAFSIYTFDKSPGTEMNDRFPFHSRPCGFVIGLTVNDFSACVRFSSSFPKGNFWILGFLVTSRFWQCRFCFVLCQFSMFGFGAS